MPLLFVCLSTQLIVSAWAFAPAPLSTCGARPSCHRRHSSSRHAAHRRDGAMARRKKDTGFGPTPTTEDATPSPAPVDHIYSMPPLYDLAFGYRSYEDEVDFLLDAHRKHAAPSPATGALRVLELAAGPARHALAALSEHPPAAVDAVVALDTSQAMVDYGRENADHALGAPGGRRDDFAYVAGDMRRVGDHTTHSFDTAWLLLGSMGHLLTNADVVACWSSVHAVLDSGGTVVVELPHPRETFRMGECTRNGWTVPLVEEAPDDDGGEKEYGALNIVWGDEGDDFDPVLQIRHMTVGLELAVHDVADIPKDATSSPLFAQMSEEGKYALKEVVPTRLYTLQEIDALARCAGFELVATYGALAEVSIEDEDEAFRMVCVLRKK